MKKLKPIKEYKIWPEEKRASFLVSVKRLVGFVADVLKYGPALPFILIGAGCNQICKWVVGGFWLGWTHNRDIS